MKKLNITLIVLASLCGFVFNSAFGDYSDCWLFGSDIYKDGGFKSVSQVWETAENKYSNFLSVGQQRQILTKNDLNTAILNLKKYCCENNLGGLSMQLKTCDDDKAFFNPNALDSQYLYDHIFDVMMRRLAGLTGDTDIYVGTNMSVDEAGDFSGKGWREFISSKAEDLSGSDSQGIIDEYLKYWEPSDSSLGYNLRKKISGVSNLKGAGILEYISGLRGEESESVAEAIKNYEKWTLHDRYTNVCALAEYFYALLSQGNIYNSDRDQITSRGSCEDLVDSQIEKENEYVQLITQRASNLFMKNYMEGYFRYLYDRETKLKTLWKDSVDRWLDVVRAVPYLTNKCVK